MSDPFLNPDSCTGGNFEALMFFGSTSLERTIEIANLLWTYDRLDGPYRHRNVSISGQSKVLPNFTDDGYEQLVGQYRHEDGFNSPFVHMTIHDDDGLWVYAGIPMGGFPEHWDVGAYPFDDGKSLDWVLPFIDELRQLTAFVRQRFPLRAAVYGWNVSPDDMLDDALNGKVHDERWDAIELQTPTGWRYYPITKLEPQMSLDVPFTDFESWQPWE
jgi:hypothetical protein